MVALVSSPIVRDLLSLVLVFKKLKFLECIAQYLLFLERDKRAEKWAKKEKRDEEGKKHQISVFFFALRSVCLQADIDNFMASQTYDFSNETR